MRNRNDVAICNVIALLSKESIAEGSTLVEFPGFTSGK